MKVDPVILRILDANSNRAAEALRVVEEAMRFGWNDKFLAGRAKQLRHDLNRNVGRLRERYALGQFRDTRGDVGTSLSTDDELKRDSLGSIVSANLARLKEALRVMEECSKALDAEVASRLERLRYEAYTFEKATQTVVVAQRRLEHVTLYGIVDGDDDERNFASRVATLAGCVDALQLRDKRLNDATLVQRARLFVEACRSRCLSIINDRPDIMLAVQADGVHVGQDDLPVDAARRIVGPEAIIGVSTHCMEQACEAELAGADYIGVGPTFPSKTKAFGDFPGLPYVEAVANEIGLPAFAIGGITADNASDVVSAGLNRVAVSHFLTAHPDPVAAASALRTSLNSKPATHAGE